jgi:hypothetical protein
MANLNTVHVDFYFTQHALVFNNHTAATSKDTVAHNFNFMFPGITDNNTAFDFLYPSTVGAMDDEHGFSPPVHAGVPNVTRHRTDNST